MSSYFYILMSQLDVFQSQILEEILRERSNYLNNKLKKNDFWLINNPKLEDLPIKSSNFYKQKKEDIVDSSDNEFYTLLISTNKEFINWLKLRLGYFENVEEIKNNNKDLFISDGLYGALLAKQGKELFKSDNERIRPSILSKRFEKSMEIYYKS